MKSKVFRPLSQQTGRLTPIPDTECFQFERHRPKSMSRLRKKEVSAFGGGSFGRSGFGCVSQNVISCCNMRINLRYISFLFSDSTAVGDYYSEPRSSMIVPRNQDMDAQMNRPSAYSAVLSDGPSDKEVLAEIDNILATADLTSISKEQGM